MRTYIWRRLAVIAVRLVRNGVIPVLIFQIALTNNPLRTPIRSSAAHGTLCRLLFRHGKRNDLPALIGRSPSSDIFSEILRYVVLNHSCHELPFPAALAANV